MSIRATKKSKDESYLDIDLEDLFGGSVPDNSSFRQSVGQEIIDTIVNRTKDSKFLSPAKQSYDPDYVETIEFKAFGKSPSEVNLTQSGDMLGLMDIIEEQASSIRIGWNDRTEQAKATNHNFGVTLPKHEFLGLTRDEAKKIRDKFKDQVEIVQSEDITQSSVDKLGAFIRGEFGIPDQRSESIFATLFSGIGLTRGSDGEG